MATEKELFDKVEEMSEGCPIFDEVDLDIPNKIKQIKGSLIKMILENMEEYCKTSDEFSSERLVWARVELKMQLFKIIRPAYEERNGKTGWSFHIYVDSQMRKEKLELIRGAIENKFNVAPVAVVKKIVKQDENGKSEFFVTKFL